MQNSGGVDKLDLEVPRKMPFRPEIARLWNDPANDQLFRKQHGGLYLVTADLRPGLGIPARLSVGHKHHEKLGPKLEIMGAGEMAFSDWANVHDQIFSGECYDNQILRADLTGDIRGVGVPAFGRAMWCRFKATNRQEYGEFQHVTTSINRYAAQTLYYGVKPRQVRFYDKTLHRAQVLLPKIHREQKRAGVELSTFFEEYGYERTEVVTRAERQMGARETAEAWGVSALGDIHKLIKFDPWERLKIAGEAEVTKALAELDPMRRVSILLLRRMIDGEGLDGARAWLRGQFPVARSYRKWWQENEQYLLDVHPMVSRELLTERYREALTIQLAA